MEHFKKAIIVLLITAGITLIGNLVKTHVSPLEALPGMLVLVLVSFIGVFLSRTLPWNIPPVAYIVTLAVIITVPGFPGAEFISSLTKKVDFLALCTPILAYAGIYTGKNLDALKSTGWRIVVLSFVVITGTYLGSALIAQLILRILGQI